MALAPRQPGSALKPFLYLAALEEGFTAATPLVDVPTTFATRTGTYAPLNFDRRFNGPIPLRVALASSLNVPAVRTQEAIGTEAFLNVAHRFGLRTLTDSEVYGLALTLGGGEVRLLDLTVAYAALANGGRGNEPFAIARIRDQKGGLIYERLDPAPVAMASAEHAFLISDILADDDARRLGFGEAPLLSLPFPTAVKTGTTTEFRDNWTLGFTADRSVGVWVGNADNRPMGGISGVAGATPIWRAVMEAAHEGLAPSWPAPPGGLVRATVCLPTGLRPGPDCPTKTDEWFLAGTVPTGVEDFYRRDSSGDILINPPPEARAWAVRAGLRLTEEDAAAATTSFWVFPAPGSRFYMAPELASQALVLRANAPAGSTNVAFWLDGAPLWQGAAMDPQVVWRLTPGRHMLEVKAMSPSGDEVWSLSHFEVLP
jgi:membrane carboxypeptidase/penicillin-binding protein PbpC